MKNILFLTPSYYPHIGGVEKHIREISLEILKDENNVTIITTKQNEDYLEYENSEGIKIIRVKWSTNKLLNKVLSIYYFFRFFSFFASAKIIHYHDVGSFYQWGFVDFFLLKLLRKKIFITFHGWEGDVPPKRIIVIKRKICEWLSDGNICIGSFIEKWYGTRADFISYGGVHCMEENFINYDYILFIGRLEEDTGIRQYIKAWRTLCREDSALKLVICGNGSLKKEIDQYIDQFKLKNIEFLGVVKDPNKFLKNARIVLTSGYLGILEAFSYKKPVVSIYDNELKKDYLEMMPRSSEMMWIVKDVDGAVKAIQEILTGNKNQKVNNAYQFSMENTWGKVKNQYYQLWEGKSGIK